MMRSMFSAVSGLRAHQVMADVIGNNIANVNTTGFKASRVEFGDTLSQLMEAGSLANEQTGTVNPTQVGLGVQVAATQLSLNPGAALVTNQATDVALQGDGYFVVRSSGEQQYSRAGSFRFDSLGRLVNPSGAIVQGWVRDEATGDINTNAPLTDITVPVTQNIPPRPTTLIEYGGNLSVDQVIGEPTQSAVEIVDGQGVMHSLTLNFDRTGIDTWDFEMTDETGAVVQSQALQFDPATGALTVPPGPVNVTFTTPNGENVTFDFDLSEVTQYGSATDPRLLSSDGVVAGSLRGFGIDNNGVISGVFSNGLTQDLGQLAVANFANSNGLGAEGDTSFRETLSSGTAEIGTPGSGGRALMNSGQLESSNVELGLEFTNLIIAQRGFQANSRVITTSDEMIQELVNLSR